MANVIDIQQFLVGKTFQIPAYQRDYAWTTIQIEELFDDVQEAMETGTGHYLGTVVLAKVQGNIYEIVDGQQRLASLTVIIHALLEELSPSDPDRIANEAILLRQGPTLKLDFGINASFVDQMFSGNSPTPTTAGQRKLVKAYEFARDRAKALTAQGNGNLVKAWLDTIKTLEIIHFSATNTGRAIRMFQSVNDRGLQLQYIDKAKAMLVYYSNRYLDGALDKDISDCFGDCFAAFDAVREFVLAPGYRVDNIDRDNFREDDILRYHYLAFYHQEAVNSGDYDASIRTVFDGFLKGTVKALRHDPNKLNSFIADYISDLKAFAVAFKSLVMAVKTDARLYRIFVVLGLAARLYPIAIRLYQRNLLFTQVPGQNIDLLHCLEVCDVRVYKTRGTDPARDIGDLSHRSRSAGVQDIADTLRHFTIRFMQDGLFQTYLSQDMYHNGALPLLLLKYDEHLNKSVYPFHTLVQLVTNKITREHIIAQTPNWSATSHGFIDDDDYQNHMHMFGNLTLLSASDNSRCQNHPVHTKITDTNLYAKSAFVGTRQLAHQYSLKGGIFNKVDVINRTHTLTSFTQSEWAIW